MALDVKTNSYIVSLEEAESIVKDTLYSDSPEFLLWEKLSDNDKEIVCKQGTKAINSLTFKGIRCIGESVLKFPRVIGNIRRDIPYEIKVATIMNGLIDKVNKSAEHYELRRNGVKSMTVGPNSVTFDSTVGGLIVYEEAREYIDKYILTSVRI